MKPFVAVDVATFPSRTVAERALLAKAAADSWAEQYWRKGRFEYNKEWIAAFERELHRHQVKIVLAA
jgi:hypothetical protein